MRNNIFNFENIRMIIDSKTFAKVYKDYWNIYFTYNNKEVIGTL